MFSSFGQQQPQGGGLFGGQPTTASTNPSPFGVPPPLPGAAPSGGGLFGSAPSATPASTSLFGAPAGAGAGLTTPQPSGLFGGSAAASPFGAPAAAAAPSPFGAPAASTGAFGSSAGVFGSTAPVSGGMFGSTAGPTQTAASPFGGASTTGISPFGAQPSGMGMGGAQGTSAQKYQTTRDTELNMKLISISAMDFYKNKSFEELRWEDYQAGRSGAAPVGTTTAGGWGQPAVSTSAAPGGGLFGSTTTPSTGGMFGSAQPQTTGGGLFGAPAAAAPTPVSGGLFGAAAPASGGLFGASSSQPTGGGLFGATSTAQPSTTGGLFGATTTAGGLFGTAAQPTTTPATSGGGLFGSAPAPASGGLFGAATPSTGGGLFGSSATTTTPAPVGGGLFGTATSAAQPGATGGLFGASTTQPTSTGGGLFGTTPAATSGGGLFGSTTTPSTTTGGGLFGTSATTAPTGTTGGGLFGSTTSATGTTGGGLFGSATSATPAAGGGLFGSSTTPGTTGIGAGLFGTTTGTTAGTSLGGGLFGGTTTTPATTSAGGGLFGTSTGGGLFGTSTTSTSSTGGGLFGSTTTPSTGITTGGGLGSLFGGPSTAPAGAAGTAAAPGGTGLGFAQGGLFGQMPSPVGTPAAGPVTPVPRPTGLVVPKPIDKDSLSAFLWKEKTSEATTPLIKKKASAPPSPKTFVPPPDGVPSIAVSPKPALAAFEEKVPSPLRLGTGPSPAIVVKPKITYTTPTKAARESLGALGSRNKSVLPVCANHNLWLKPSIEAMSGMTESELARVEHFQIGQYGVGSVTWPGITDVRFLIVDDIIQFRKGAVTLFPDEELKPPVGTGLNKTAIIELYVKPKNYELAKKYESRYVAEMKKLTESNGAEFLSYDLDTWRFRVEHFSTWGIDEMEWDRIDLAGGSQREKSQNDLSLFSRIERDVVSTPVKATRTYDDSDIETDNEPADQSMDLTAPEAARIYTKSDFVGALAIPPPTREELKAMGWDLRACDLFLNQSFRASLKDDNSVVFPEHPVVYDSYKLSTAAAVDKRSRQADSDTLLLRAAVEKRSVDEIIELLEKYPNERSVFTLVQALIGEPAEKSAQNRQKQFYPSGSPMSDQGDDGIDTNRFNEWLSRSNASTVQSRGNSAFHPAAALTSRHYEPSASELLIASGNPRLALVAAAAANEASRQLMKPQLEQVEASEDVQDVYKILGGDISGLSKSTVPDWRSELALRYWYGGGDLAGFEVPNQSIEWRIINTLVKGDSKELVSLIDTNENISPCLMLAVATSVRNLRGDLISQHQYNHLVRSCADELLERKNWQWAVVCLSLLPRTDLRERMMFEIMAKNIGSDCSIIEEFGVLSHDKLVMARAMQELGHGNIEAAKDLLSRHGLKKMATLMTDTVPGMSSGSR